MSERGFEDALRWLARRPLSGAELRQRLEDKGHGPEEVEAACARLHEAGYLDDEKLALDYIVARVERLGHGPERLLRDLVERGVKREVAEAAWTGAVERGDVDPGESLRKQLRRRVGSLTPRAGSREHARVYNALLRAGFAAEDVRRELEPYLSESGPPGDDDTEGRDDDFP